MTQIPEKINEKTEVPDAKHFLLEAVFDAEHERLIAWLEGAASASSREPQPTKDGLASQGKTCIDTISQRYGDRNRAMDKELVICAGDGSLQRYVPPVGMIRAYRIIFWLAFSLEIAIGLVLWLQADGAPGLAIMALLLSCGGVLMGRGVAGLFERHMGAGWPQILRPPAPPSLSVNVAMTVAGALIIGVVSYLRAFGEDAEGMMHVVALTVLLAFLIMAFEALHTFNKHKYEFLRDRMATAQRFYAIHRHADSLANYLQVFYNKVEQIQPGFLLAIGKR